MDDRDMETDSDSGDEVQQGVPSLGASSDEDANMFGEDNEADGQEEDKPFRRPGTAAPNLPAKDESDNMDEDESHTSLSSSSDDDDGSGVLDNSAFEHLKGQLKMMSPRDPTGMCPPPRLHCLLIISAAPEDPMPANPSQELLPVLWDANHADLEYDKQTTSMGAGSRSSRPTDTAQSSPKDGLYNDSKGLPGDDTSLAWGKVQMVAPKIKVKPAKKAGEMSGTGGKGKVKGKATDKLPVLKAWGGTAKGESTECWTTSLPTPLYRISGCQPFAKIKIKGKETKST